MDLASGHVSALKLLDEPKCYAVNLGTGAGSSVLDVVRAFEAASGKRIPYDVKPRRPGDLAAYYAATDYASRLMDWKATRSLEAMCADHWRWQNNNPNGYA
jgi:UDP-glucose 4-epimerase